MSRVANFVAVIAGFWLATAAAASELLGTISYADIEKRVVSIDPATGAFDVLADAGSGTSPFVVMSRGSTFDPVNQIMYFAHTGIGTSQFLAVDAATGTISTRTLASLSGYGVVLDAFEVNYLVPEPSAKAICMSGWLAMFLLKRRCHLSRT